MSCCIILLRSSMLFIVCLAGLSGAASTACAGGGAVAQQMSWYQTATMKVLSNARDLIEPTLPDDQLDIAKSIRYRVTSSPGIGAFAAYESGHRVIVIHAGTIQMIDWFVDLAVINEELGREGCYKEYASYLTEMISDNASAVANHMPLMLTKSPIVYASTTDGNCAGITSADFTAVDDYGKLKSGMIESSIMFLYLHELGHHVLHHTDGKKTYDKSGLAMSRKQEDAADMYAVEAAMGANYSLTPAIPWFMFMAQFGGDSIEAEEKSDHPLGLRRVLHVYDKTIDFYEDHPDRLSERGLDNEALSDLKKQRSLLADQLSSIDK